MKHLKMIAAAMAMLALNGCIGVIFPIPLPGGSSDNTPQDTERNQSR